MNPQEALCNHVAEQNPRAATELIRKYGYRRIENVRSAKDLGKCLQDLVRYEGERAVMDIAAIHPDRELILSTVPASEQDLHFTAAPQRAERIPCGCHERYMNATGEQPATNQTAQFQLVSQTNIFLLASALLIAAAIIVKK